MDRSGPQRPGRGPVVGCEKEQPIPNTGTLTDGDGPFSKEDPGEQSAKYPPFHCSSPTRRVKGGRWQ